MEKLKEVFAEEAFVKALLELETLLYGALFPN